MKKFDANSWEDREVYIAKKKREENRKVTEVKGKKDREKKLKEHNFTIKGIANHYTEEMTAQPSELEKKMQQFLDNQDIVYDFQRIFYIKGKSGYIKKFYIADFYIPSKSLIIETDGAFHDMQLKEDDLRTKNIQKHYPNIKVIRWRWHDFESYVKMKDLISKIK